jgi:hypothetical protein
MAYSEVEYGSGWNQACWELARYGLAHAETILSNDLPTEVDNAYISGKREAARTAQLINDVPMRYEQLYAV